MLTARDTMADKVRGLDAGADDYLVKPFALEELFARVRALLRRPKETVTAQLSLGGITINPLSKEVVVNERYISLTLREFNILEYLMQNSNRVLTREQILVHVWDFAFDASSNVVDVHIKNIRKKLGSPYENNLQTLRGMGYRFKV